MARAVDSHAGLSGQSRANRVARASERTAQYVEARTNVAGAAGRKSAHDATSLDRVRRGQLAGSGWSGGRDPHDRRNLAQSGLPGDCWREFGDEMVYLCITSVAVSRS